MGGYRGRRAPWLVLIMKRVALPAESAAAGLRLPKIPITFSSDEARDAARAVAEAGARVHSPDYVESCGILLPPAEYFVQAVTGG